MRRRRRMRMRIRRKGRRCRVKRYGEGRAGQESRGRIGDRKLKEDIGMFDRCSQRKEAFDSPRHDDVKHDVSHRSTFKRETNELGNET